MIFKRAFFLAVALFIVASTNAMAAMTYLDSFVLSTLDIDSSSSLVLQSNRSFGIIKADTNSKIENFLKLGYAGGAWNGLGGIDSSVAAADPLHATALGMLGGQFYGETKFAGHTVAPGDSLIRFTYYGDINLDGAVNDDDYMLFFSGYGMTGYAHWMDGDFNYDGNVDDTDFGLMDYVHTLNLPSLGPAGPYVPEPSTLVMLFSLALGGLFWRRRRA